MQIFLFTIWRAHPFLIAGTSVFLVASSLYNSAISQSWDDLKGLSVKSKFHFTGTYRVLDNGGSAYNTGNGTVPGRYQNWGTNFEINFYVSLKGNIFEYARNANTNETGFDSITPDHARERPMPNHPQGPSYTWTMMNNRPTRVTQYTGGFWIINYEIDPKQMRCSLSARLERSPGSNAIFENHSSGKLMEIYARQVDSFSCNVTRGNIFASDQ